MLNVQRSHTFSLDEHYHLYSRGVEKKIIFVDDSDYKRFEILLFLCNQEKAIHVRDISKDDYFNKDKRDDPLVAIGSWCLMPNHFHLLIKEIKEGGTSKFMEKVMTAYSMYFNKKYDRTGRLFESTFRSQHIDTDGYLRHISAYIHLNPLSLKYPEWKKGIVDSTAAVQFLGTYAHSSYLDYKDKDKRLECNIIAADQFPEYYASFDEMISDYQNWIGVVNERNT